MPLHSALTPPQSGFFIIHLRGHLVYLLKSLHLPLQTSSARGTGRAICVAYACQSYVGGVAPALPSLLKPATAFNTLIRVYPLNGMEGAPAWTSPCLSERSTGSLLLQLLLTGGGHLLYLRSNHRIINSVRYRMKERERTRGGD